MKRALLLIASVALLLVGCAKETNVSDVKDGEMITASFTAQMQSAPQTKAVTDGGGTNANRCVMEIYYQGVLYAREVKSVSNMKATFTPRLVSNRTYDVLFWADCGEENLADKYYTTNAEGLGLQAVEMKTTSYAANDDARDAFFAKESVEVLQQVSTKEFQLKRPFSQVNIITTDAAIIKNANLYPNGVKMVYTAPTKFNLLTGELSQEVELTVTGTPYEPFDATSAALTLEMDYLFASSLEQSALDIAFEASKTGETAVTKHSFTNIPVKRNYRTNIKGALLTTTGDWTATIVPDWSQPDEEVEFVEAGSVAAANEAFANGATSVKITSVGEETTLYLPLTTADVTIDFATPDKDVTVKYGPEPTPAPVPAPTTKGAVEGDKPSVVNIATNDVTKFVVTGISNIVWLAGNQTALANALTNAKSNHTVALSNDITMSGQWTPATTNGYTVDGRNHVISNMTITDCGKDYAGLISFMSGGVVKNITVKDANIVYNSGSSARGGAIVGISYGGTIENCHAENVSIKGYQKMGGIVGYLAQSGNGFVVRNCSAKNISFTNNTTDLTYQAGGIVGYTLNYNGDILVEGCSVSDITINYQYDGSEGANLPYYCGTFIGSLDNQAAKEGLKIELKNNTISGTNTPQIDQMYANTYFGWANNNECTLKSKPYFATILIDGVEWTPNYPVKNVTKGTSYPTLAKAVEAASAGDEINITAAGTYTVPDISKNITVAGDAEGDVVFNCAGSGSIASISNGATFKNVTMNFGQSSYHGFQAAGHIVMDECTLNGLFFSYGDMTFNECIFNQENEEYNMWTYAGDITYDGCTFNSKGKFLNIYRESAIEYEVVAKNCVFNTSKKNKAALNIKETCNAIFLKYNVTVENCSCNELQNSLENKDDGTLYRVSPIWQVDDRKDGVTGINVTVDGSKVYPFCSKDADGNYHIINAAGLLQFHDLYADGKVAYTAKVYIDNDIDFTGKTWTACEWHADGALKGFALFDGQNHTIKNFTVNGQGMFSRWACTANIGATPYFKDIVFDGAKNVESAINVSLFCGQTYQNAKIENVTIKNSQFEGTYKVAPFVGTVYDENATGPTLTLKDCKVENTTVKGTSYDFDICGMVAWVYEENNDKVAFEGNNVVKDVTLYIPAVTYNMCAKIYHNGETAYDEAANVTVSNVNVVPIQ